MTIREAVKKLQMELDLLGATSVTLSSNVRTRLDGEPYSTAVEPEDSGVALYFRLKASDHCMACERWTRVADNITAIAKHIAAMRGIERWGVGDTARVFMGYKALPAPTAEGAPPCAEWATHLGFITDELSLSDYEDAFRRLARKHHPDIGENPDPEVMMMLNNAIAEARRAKA